MSILKLEEKKQKAGNDDDTLLQTNRQENSWALETVLTSPKLQRSQVNTEKGPNIQNFKKGITQGNYDSIKHGFREEIDPILQSFLSVQIIQQVQNNNTRACNYSLFHIPFTYVLCDTIQTLKPKDSSLLVILAEQVKKLNVLNRTTPQQLPSEEMVKGMVDALNIKKMPAGYYLKELKSVLEKHKIKMSTFFPYFYYMFEMIANRQQFITLTTTVNDLTVIYNEKKEWVRAKYHNQDLQ